MSGDDKKVVGLDLPRDASQAALEEARRSMPTLIEFAKMTAEVRRAAYEACLAVGFTEGQALYLCRSPWLIDGERYGQ